MAETQQPTGEAVNENPDEQLDSFIDIDTSNVPDAVVLPEGEQRIRLKVCEAKLSSKQKPQIVAVYIIPTEPMVDDMYQYIQLPTPDMDEKKTLNTLRRLAEWKQMHGLLQSGAIDLNEVGRAGIEVYAHIVIDTYQGVRKNKIGSFTRAVETA